MNLAEATITQLLIPIDDFERGVAFYRDCPRIALAIRCGSSDCVLPVRSCSQPTAGRYAERVKDES